MTADNTKRGDNGPAVENGVLRYVSPSQITTFDPGQEGGCPARWYFDKVLKVPVPDTSWQDKGKKEHEEIEHYLRTGEDVLSAIVRPGKHLIPKPGPDLKVELAIGDILKASGVPVIGYIDLFHARGWTLDEEGELRPEEPGTFEVVDWKTTSNIASWAKAGSALVQTVQMATYGMVAARLGAKQVRLSHVYFQTKGRAQAVKRTALVQLPVLHDRWKEIEGTVASMKATAKIADVKDVDRNYDSCGAFRGCPFRDRCPRPAAVTLAEIFGKGDAMGLLDKLRAGATPATNPPPPAVTPAPATLPPATVVDKSAIEAEIARLKAIEEKAKAPPPVQPGALIASQAKQGQKYQAKTSEGWVPVTYIALTKGGYAFGLEGGAVIQIPGDETIYPTGVQAPDVPVEAPNPAPEATTAPATDEAPKRRGRPPGSKNKPKEGEAVGGGTEKPGPDTLPVSATPAPAPAPAATGVVVSGSTPAVEVAYREVPSQDSTTTTAPAPIELDKKKAAPAQAPNLVFFRDCIPVKSKEKFENLEPYVTRLCRVLEEQYKAADLRCGGKDTPLGYGGWKGALAALIRAEPPKGSGYLLGTRSGEVWQVAADAIEEVAAVVVRGV